jgi:hypothetical protein
MYSTYKTDRHSLYMNTRAPAKDTYSFESEFKINGALSSERCDGVQKEFFQEGPVNDGFTL